MCTSQYPYKDWQHTETFVAGKLMQTGIYFFFFFFWNILDNKTVFIKINVIFSIKHCFWWRWEYQVHRLGEIEESHVMDATKSYLTKRSVVQMAFILSIKLFKNNQFHLVHIYAFRFSFCSHSGKPLYAERGIAHFTLSSGTDQSYMKPYFVWHCRKYEYNKLKWICMADFAVKYMPKYSLG